MYTNDAGAAVTANFISFYTLPLINVAIENKTKNWVTK